MIMRRKKIVLTLVLSSLIFLFLSIQISAAEKAEHYNCYTILVGKKASISGAVLFAHNEDDWGDQVVYWYKVPRQRHAAGEVYTLKHGGKLPQVVETWGYLWLEIPDMDFADSFLNEWGVAIASNACPSRRDEADLTDGGIDYDLRRLIAERARTAREGVKLAGQLIEHFGYNSSGRTYSIADPNEVWLLAVVRGKLWLAQRVPDDAVAIIPNYYIIGEVNLNDTLNFLTAPAIVTYAIEQGWYRPDSNQPFNFRLTYSNPDELTNINNRARHWRGLNTLAARSFALTEPFPTTFKPKQKISRTDLFQVLRQHYENTDLDCSGNPHANPTKTVCSEANQYGFVAELRNWLPPAIGAIIWIAPRRPCVMPFFPIYVGVSQLPPAMAPHNYQIAQAQHFNPAPDLYNPDNKLLYWQCAKATQFVDDDWPHRSPIQIKRRQAFESKLLRRHDRFDVRLVRNFTKKTDACQKALDNYISKTIHRLQQFIVQ